ncbi:unnamed protein product [Calypogeia fissa]
MVSEARRSVTTSTGGGFVLVFAHKRYETGSEVGSNEQQVRDFLYVNFTECSEIIASSYVSSCVRVMTIFSNFVEANEGGGTDGCCITICHVRNSVDARFK